MFADLGKFKRAGAEYTCHCPFTDKANKFQFSTTKPTWYSWTLGEGGGWMEYLQRRNGWDWRQALEHLADAAGIKLGKLDEAAEQKRDTRTAIFDAAMRHFRSELFNERGVAVLDYLTGRGYTTEELRELEIGAYCDVNRIKALLHKLGFKGEAVEASGLTPPKSRGFGTTYQVVFPWTDYAGRTTGLVARSMLPQDELNSRDIPKYKYSTGSKIASGLFGLDRARGKQAVVVVEGGLDAMFLNHHGIPTVATGGLGFNEQQVDALERARFSELLVCWDMDDRGQTATAKLLERLYPRPFKVYVVSLPDGFKDPDELVRSEGAEAFKTCLEQAGTAARWHGAYLAGCFNLQHARGRDRAVDAVHTLAEKIQHVDHKRELADGFTEVSGLKIPSLGILQGAGGRGTGEGEMEKVQGSRGDEPREQADFYNEPDPAATTTEKGAQRKFQATAREKRDLGLTDVANASAFAEENNHDLRHCSGYSKSGNPRTGWMLWDGVRWVLDDTGLVVERAKSFVGSLWNSAEKHTKRKREVSRNWWAQCQGVKAINAMLSLCPSNPSFTLRQEDLDKHPLKLNLQNGVYDLQRMELGDHDPDLKLTRLMPVDFEEGARCPQWIDFLLWAMTDPALDDEYQRDTEAAEMVEYLARWWGYCLTGKTHIQVWVYHHGDGDNGKSVHNLVMNGLFGKVEEGGYLANASPEILLSQRNGAQDHERRLSRLENCRVVIGAEINKGSVLDEAQLKRLTGGEPVQARRLYNDEFSFDPHFKLMFSANYLPRVKGGGHGTWRRLQPVKWPNQITQADRIFEFHKVLLKEAPGILNWALDGWADVCDRLIEGHDPLAPPPPVVRAASAYRESSDIVGIFVKDHLVKGHSEHAVNCRSVYDAFVVYAEKEGISKYQMLSMRQFNVELESRDFIKEKMSGAMAWLNVRLEGISEGEATQ